MSAEEIMARLVVNAFWPVVRAESLLFRIFMALLTVIVFCLLFSLNMNSAYVNRPA